MISISSICVPSPNPSGFGGDDIWVLYLLAGRVCVLTGSEAPLCEDELPAAVSDIWLTDSRVMRQINCSFPLSPIHYVFYHLKSLRADSRDVEYNCFYVLDYHPAHGAGDLKFNRGRFWINPDIFLAFKEESKNQKIFESNAY